LNSLLQAFSAELLTTLCCSNFFSSDIVQNSGNQLTQGFYRSRKTGKSQGICMVRERSGKNIIFWKVRKNDLGSRRLQISV